MWDIEFVTYQVVQSLADATAISFLNPVIGMLLAAPGIPGWSVLLFGNLGIALLAGAAAVVNHVVDQKIDTVMARTRKRPVATGRIAPLDALLFATVHVSLRRMHWRAAPLPAGTRGAHVGSPRVACTPLALQC